MAKTSKVNVPVTVDTSGMDKPLRDAERKVKASAERMAKASAKANVGGGLAARGGQVGLSAFGRGGALLQGAGPVGMAIGAAALPAIAFGQIQSAFESAVKGATLALEQFRETGKQTMAANSVVLEKLAEAEKANPVLQGTNAQAMVAAGQSGTGRQSWFFDVADAWSEQIRRELAEFSARMSGQTAEEAFIQGDLAVTTSEDYAQVLKEMLVELRRKQNAETSSAEREWQTRERQAQLQMRQGI